MSSGLLIWHHRAASAFWILLHRFRYARCCSSSVISAFFFAMASLIAYCLSSSVISLASSCSPFFSACSAALAFFFAFFLAFLELPSPDGYYGDGAFLGCSVVLFDSLLTPISAIIFSNSSSSSLFYSFLLSFLTCGLGSIRLKVKHYKSDLPSFTSS